MGARDRLSDPEAGRSATISGMVDIAPLAFEQSLDQLVDPDTLLFIRMSLPVLVIYYR